MPDFNSSISEKDYIESLLDLMEEKELDISESGLGPWSHSKIKTFSSCSLMFLLKNILRINLTISEDDVSAKASLGMKYTGLATHLMIEKMLDGTSFADALLLAETEYKSNCSEEQWNDILLLEDRITYFVDRFHQGNKGKGLLGHTSEQKLAISIDQEHVEFTSDKVFYRGILDLTAKFDSGDTVIFDHKNGGSAEHGIRNYESQLKGQALLLAASDSSVNRVLPFVHFIQEGSILNPNISYSRERILEEFLTSIRSGLQGSLEALKEDGRFKQKSQNLCKYCEFSVGCKSGKRGSGGIYKPIIDKSKMFFRG